MTAIARVLKAFGAAIGLLRHGFVAGPLALYFLLKLSLIVLYAYGRSGPADAFWKILLPGSSAEALSHYPDRLIVMPIVLGRLDIPLEILALSSCRPRPFSSSRSRDGRTPRRAGGRLTARARYFHLAAATGIASAALFAAFRYPASLLARLPGIPDAGRLAIGIALSIAVQALFLYAIPFIVLEGRSAIDATRRSAGFAARHFAESITLVAVPFVVALPTMLLTLDPRTIAFRISPEFLVHVRIAGELVEFASGYLLVGGLTIYFLATRLKEEKK